jgi:hypothetical protein
MLAEVTQLRTKIFSIFIFLRSSDFPNSDAQIVTTQIISFQFIRKLTAGRGPLESEADETVEEAVSEESTGMVVARARAEFRKPRNRCIVGLRACFWIVGLDKATPASTMPSDSGFKK